MGSDFEHRTDDHGHVGGAETRLPAPASHEAPPISVVATACACWWYKAVEAVLGCEVEESLSKDPLEIHVHMGVALSALRQADAHFGKKFVEAFFTRLTPDVQFGRKIRRVEHAVI